MLTQLNTITQPQCGDKRNEDHIVARKWSNNLLSLKKHVSWKFTSFDACWQDWKWFRPMDRFGTYTTDTLVFVVHVHVYSRSGYRLKYLLLSFQQLFCSYHRCRIENIIQFDKRHTWWWQNFMCMYKYYISISISTLKFIWCESSIDRFVVRTHVRMVACDLWWCFDGARTCICHISISMTFHAKCSRL